MLARNRRLSMRCLNTLAYVRRFNWLGHCARQELFTQRGFQIRNEFFQHPGLRNWFRFRLRSCRRVCLHRDFFDGGRNFFCDRLFHGSRNLLSHSLRGGNVLKRDFVTFDRDFARFPGLKWQLPTSAEGRASSPP